MEKCRLLGSSATTMVLAAFLFGHEPHAAVRPAPIAHTLMEEIQEAGCDCALDCSVLSVAEDVAVG
jgi:hypothetical protein